jgi:hypothetical protein
MINGEVSLDEVTSLVEDCNIYLYKSYDAKNFIRSAVCRGHSGAVTHFDFFFKFTISTI